MLARILHISYEAVNVLVFCVAWPAYTAWLLLTIRQLRRKLKTNTSEQTNNQDPEGLRQDS